MRKTIIISSLCAVALMTGAFVAQADARPHYNNMGNNQQAYNSNLSAEDQAKLTELGKAFAEQNKALYFTLEDKNYELNKLYRAGNPDPAAVQKLESEISAARTKLFEAREAFRLQLQKEMPNAAYYGHDMYDGCGNGMMGDGMMNGGMMGGGMGMMGGYHDGGYHNGSRMHR